MRRRRGGPQVHVEMVAETSEASAQAVLRYGSLRCLHKWSGFSSLQLCSQCINARHDAL